MSNSTLLVRLKSFLNLNPNIIMLHVIFIFISHAEIIYLFPEPFQLLGRFPLKFIKLLTTKYEQHLVSL